MGLSGGASKSSSRTLESTLSKRQATILKKREEQYQQFFFPEMLGIVSDVNMDNALASPQVSNANQAYETALSSFSTQAARRGLSGSGFEAVGLASLGGAKANAVSSAVSAGQQQGLANRMSLMQIAQGFAPTPTQSAQYHQKASSSSWSAAASA